jgi:hypothetical protein
VVFNFGLFCVFVNFINKRESFKNKREITSLLFVASSWDIGYNN